MYLICSNAFKVSLSPCFFSKSCKAFPQSECVWSVLCVVSHVQTSQAFVCVWCVGVYIEGIWPLSLCAGQSLAVGLWSFWIYLKLPATCLVLLSAHISSLLFTPVELNQCMCIPEYMYVRINVRWFLKNNRTEWHLQYLLLFLTCLRKHDICENGVRLWTVWRAVDGLWLKHHDQHGL